MTIEQFWDNAKVFITASAVAAALEALPELYYLPYALSIIFGFVLSVKLGMFWFRFKRHTRKDTGVPFVCLRVSEFKAAVAIASIHAVLLIGTLVLYIITQDRHSTMPWAMNWTFAGVFGTGSVALYFFARQVMNWLVVSRKAMHDGK